jgi:hypothetical protein
MAATHASGVLQASVSNGVGATTTSSTYDNTANYGAIITAKISNTGGAPGVACGATLNVSPDGTTWYAWSSQYAGVTASAVYPLAFTVPPEAIKAQIVFASNTTVAVTVEAQYQALTGI